MDLSKSKAIFFHEAHELCDALESALLDRDRFPANVETYNLMFRTAHTIKGSAGMFGLDAVVRFAHVLEDVLERLRSGQLPLSDNLVTLLLECNDHLRRLVDAGESDESAALLDMPEGEALLAQLRRYQPTGKREAPTEAKIAESALTTAAGDSGLCCSSPYWQFSLRFHADIFREGFDPFSLLTYLSGFGTIRHIQPVWREWPPLSGLDATECFLGYEISYESDENEARIRGTFEFIEADSLIGILPPHASLRDYRTLAEQLEERLGEPLAEQVDRWLAHNALTPEEAARVVDGSFGVAEASMPAEQDEAAAATADQTLITRRSDRTDAQFMRIETSKLDQLINRVGELVIAASVTTLLAKNREDTELLESVAVTNALVEDIRDDALALRMVPVSEVFGRFPRMIREVSQQLGKTIRLEIKGAETEIDKLMVEKLSDPLIHIVRNAVDHGLEPAGQRVAANKPEAGTVTLNAYHDAGAVVVEVQDDGRGIDCRKVLAKAIERGLVQEGGALSEQETLQLIFLPGFSTAANVSDISGRGVGLDVVKRNLDALRGEVEIITSPGTGTTFRLRLPLTLAIIDGFLVEAGEFSLVMSHDMMIECISLPSELMKQRSRQLNVRGSWLPIVSLRELFSLPQAAGPEFIVIVHYADKQAGIVVDRLIGNMQAVVKPLGSIFKSLRGISGATILGNGKPALILDVPQLIQHALSREKRSIRQQTETILFDRQ